MANMIDLDTFRTLTCFFDFGTRSFNVLELMESILILSLSILSSPEDAVTNKFTNCVHADMAFRHSFFRSCFIDQKITSCMGSSMKGLWFTFAHTEIGGGASFALLNKGIKNCCAAVTSTGTRFFELCCHYPEAFLKLLQRSPRES